MKIQYYKKNVYGTDCNYPVSDDAKLVTSLTGRKTLSEDDLKKLKKHGCELTRVIGE